MTTSARRRSPERLVWISALEWGLEFKRWRTRHGLSVLQLAKYLGFAAPTLYRWEHGELTPEHPELINIALMHLDCGDGKIDRPRQLGYQLKDLAEQLGAGSLTSTQLRGLRGLQLLAQELLADNDADTRADSADQDADNADSGRLALRRRRLDPDAW